MPQEIVGNQYSHERLAEPIVSDSLSDEMNRVYARIAPGFFRERLDPDSHFESIVWPVFKSYLGKVRGNQVLDLGCGPGVVTDKLHQMGANVIGVDSSFEMVSIAHQNFLHNGRDPHFSRFYRADAINLPFQGESMDMVVASYVLNHLGPEDLLKAMKEARRILRPEGKFMIMDPHPDRNQKYYEAGGGAEKRYPSGWYKEGWPELGKHQKIPVYYRHEEDWVSAFEQSGLSTIEMHSPTSTSHPIEGLAPDIEHHYKECRILILKLVK